MDHYAVNCLAVVTADRAILCQPGVETVRVIDTATGNELWLELHTKKDPDEEWFRGWCGRVPEYGPCGCSSWLKDYLANNPYPVDQVQPEVLSGLRTRYGWTLHNAVNKKLDRPEFSWAEFERKYERSREGF